MDRVRNLINCDQVHRLGYTGRGVGVAILDTGACVVQMHKDLFLHHKTGCWQHKYVKSVLECKTAMMKNNGYLYEDVSEKLNQMLHTDIRNLCREQLADVQDICIDEKAPREERIRSFLEQTGNPFAQTVGNYILQTGYQEDTEDTIDDRMILLAKRQSQITGESI